MRFHRISIVYWVGAFAIAWSVPLALGLLVLDRYESAGTYWLERVINLDQILSFLCFGPCFLILMLTGSLWPKKIWINWPLLTVAYTVWTAHLFQLSKA